MLYTGSSIDPVGTGQLSFKLKEGKQTASSVFRRRILQNRDFQQRSIVVYYSLVGSRTSTNVTGNVLKLSF